jgi:hypothetical protein
VTTNVIDEWVWEIQKLYNQHTQSWPIIISGTRPGRDTEMFRKSRHNEMWLWYPQSMLSEDYWELFGLAMDKSWATYMVSTSEIISRGLDLPDYECVPDVWIYRMERLSRSTFL